MRTVDWEDNRVAMIDQRLLPGELVIATFETVADVARSIREMYVRGAPAIGATGAYGMVAGRTDERCAPTPTSLLADLLAAKDDAGCGAAYRGQPELGHSRGCCRWPKRRPRRVRRRLRHARCWPRRNAWPTRMSPSTGGWVFTGPRSCRTGPNILHHCNTGTLAAVDFGTALGVVYACHEQGKRIHVWVDETRPRLQGARLTAWELMRAEIPMHLIADNAAGASDAGGQGGRGVCMARTGLRPTAMSPTRSGRIRSAWSHAKTGFPSMPSCPPAPST